jgi:quercetin dioxygenase-like cupin family protein
MTRLVLQTIAILALIFGVPARQHTMVTPDALKWEPVSPTMWRAVLSGSPDSDGAPFVLRIKMADGAKVPPHWHPVDEHLTVISGTFHMGVGETFTESAAMSMTTGSYSMLAKEIRHFAWATGETVVQIHGVGPFKTYFVAQSK